MLDFNYFELGNQCPTTIVEDYITLGNINIKNLRKCTTKTLGGTYTIYKISSDKLNLCRIWDKSNSKIMERALKYSILHNLEITICTTDKFRKSYQPNNILFTTENTITGLELEGSRVIGNYFAILIDNKLFM